MDTSPPRAPGYDTRLPSLTGLRFVAAMLVFLCHITLAYNPVGFTYGPINLFADPDLAGRTEKFFGTAGSIGVSFFFVLSGFVLAWSAKPTDTAPLFWRRRVLKVYPNHLVIWTLAMILFAAETTRPGAWIPNFFLLQGYFPQVDTMFGVNSPSWSLCCEMLFYLLFPFLLRPVRRIPERLLWACAAACVAGALGVELLAHYVVGGEVFPGFPVSLTQVWIGYVFPPSRLFEFVLGMLLVRIILSGRRVPVGLVPAAGLFAVAYVIATYSVPFLFSLFVVTLVPVAAIIYAAAVADVSGRRTLLSGPRMRWLGDISFGFFICQGVVVFYGRRLIGAEEGFSTPVALLVSAGFLLATLAGGWLLYTFVETPIMRRWSRPRRRPADPARPAGSAPAAARPAPSTPSG